MYWENNLDPAVSFGRVLRDARKAAGLTQEQLALKAGVERNYVSLIERGINQPTIRMLFKLANALDIPPQILVERTDVEVRSAED
jgi:transcriptional regulator with XRE-family HTH domain